MNDRFRIQRNEAGEYRVQRRVGWFSWSTLTQTDTYGRCYGEAQTFASEEGARLAIDRWRKDLDYERRSEQWATVADHNGRD